MARTQFVDTPDELKLLALKAHQKRDRYILGVVQGQRALPSRRQARLLRRASVVHSPQQGRGSLFKYLSPYWRGLSSGTQALWKAAGAPSALTNWQLFISDNAARIRNSVTFPATPSDVWQVRAGQIVINSPASEILLRQDHPQSYVVAQKIPGTPWKYELVSVDEVFSLPLTLGISYKSDLVATGPTQRARLYAKVVWSYQGVDRETDLAIDFDPSHDWVADTIELSSRYGILLGYTLYLDIFGYTGTLLFDNISATHGGTNWARDPRCDDVSKIFTKSFAIVPPFWVPESMPTGASFSTVFPPAV